MWRMPGKTAAMYEVISHAKLDERWPHVSQTACGIATNNGKTVSRANASQKEVPVRIRRGFESLAHQRRPFT